MILSKYDIEQMTDGQREIYYAGVLGERKRIVALLKENFISKRDANVDATIGVIEAISLINRQRR